MEKITVENLSFAYPDGQKYAIRGVNLEVSAGEFVTICGKSGSGKSTLLRLLKPSLAPNGEVSGNIFIDGKRVSDLSPREDAEKIGFVFQNPENQIVTDKVWHELAFGLESLSYSKEEIRLRVAEMASFFGLGDIFEKNVTELSGGQKQILSLASVMALSPEVLILDEPTSRLDPIAAQKFIDAVYKINRELGVTVIISEHNLSEVFALSDRVIVMEEGEIISDDTPRKTGSRLADIDSDMFKALPTPTRAYFSKESDLACPITVREGRAWLSKMPKYASCEKETEEKRESARVFEVSECYFRYEKNSKDVLSGLNLNLREGELYVIVGGNGAGKTTALSVISGIKKPYLGKVRIADGKKLSYLPQNPQTLFVRNTVGLDLMEILKDETSLTEDEKLEKVTSLMQFFGIDHLKDRHPYDLSGGEQEKAALAKVLLTSPDILLLDEPTKGLDAHFKAEFGEVLHKLLARGISILMVSHDIEFAARYATRCGMFFGGEIVSEGSPREFFREKSFYTTEAGRMSRGILEDALTAEDIVSAIGGKERVKKEKSEKKKDVFLEKKEEIVKSQEKKLNKKSIIISCIFFLILIPLTIIAGTALLDSRKYYFISLAVIAETLVPFFVMFESRKPAAKEIVIIAVMCALAVVGRVAFEMLPQFKPVAALVIISGIMLGGEAGFLVGATSAFVSNFFFGQTPFTPWQMLAFGLIGFLSGVIYKKGMPEKKLWLCVFGFVSVVVIYGGILNPVSVILGQPDVNLSMILTAYATGFAFDIIHASATAVFLWFIAKPFEEKLLRIKKKYGIGK